MSARAGASASNPSWLPSWLPPKPPRPPKRSPSRSPVHFVSQRVSQHYMYILIFSCFNARSTTGIHTPRSRIRWLLLKLPHTSPRLTFKNLDLYLGPTVPQNFWHASRTSAAPVYNSGLVSRTGETAETDCAPVLALTRQKGAQLRMQTPTSVSSHHTRAPLSPVQAASRGNTHCAGRH